MNTILSLFILIVAASYLTFWLMFRAAKNRSFELEQQVLEKAELLMYAQANERKAIEQTGLTEKSKKELLVRINRDIRTPLNGIMGTVSLLADTTLSSEQREYNETIRQCGEKLISTLNIELAKMNGGLDELSKASIQEVMPEIGPTHPTQKLSIDFAKQFPLRILVAEDDRINQKMALRTLTKLGYSPDIAQNGKEVLEEVSKVNYDLILMDIQMPEMDGLEATRMIRLCLTSQPIIIAMTANALEGDKEECLQAGMDDYISKPVHLEKLVVMLEKWATHVKEKLN
jgi:CheY-like chemotaxis protein